MNSVWKNPYLRSVNNVRIADNEKDYCYIIAVDNVKIVDFVRNVDHAKTVHYARTDENSKNFRTYDNSGLLISELLKITELLMV